MDQYLKDKVYLTFENLKLASHKTVVSVDSLKYISCEYKKTGEFPTCDESWNDFGRYDRVFGKDKHFWFYKEVHTPSVNEDEELYLEISTGKMSSWDPINPQGLVYLNGKITQGIDINHRKVYLKPNTKYEIMFYFYVGMIDTHVEVNFDIKVRNKKIDKLYYDMLVPYDALKCFNEKDYSYIVTLKYLEQTCNMIDLRDVNSKAFYKSVDLADKYICEEYYAKVCSTNNAVVSYIGHTHIDVAWLWTLAQTREKLQRTFSTVLALMDRYPEYVFMSSQPQLYQYLKEEEPELYERVKDKVKEGRWEVEGAMWLEADCNLSSGESLVRQILYGKRFIKEEFGKESKILWLPDVFGYSAALPQILKKSGVEKFVTSKISWNDTNMMPYDTFMWQGIDGTEIFSYFLTAQTHDEYLKNETFTTYVGRVTPEMNLGTWERYQQKEYNNETIVTFGYGDGGGGPTEEMIETELRLEHGLPGIPKSQMSFAGDFLDRVEKNFKANCATTGRTPKWVGELYLELHRGTYTSIGKNKKNNRKSEFLCQEAELLSVTNAILNKAEYPKNELDEAWKLVMLNQFHDIIPGTSIKEVYADSDTQYEHIRRSVGRIKNSVLSYIADNVSDSGILVYNPNSFAVSGYVKYNNDMIYVKDIPSMGWRLVKDRISESNVKISERRIESEHYVVDFDTDMNICSIFDKDFNRQVIADKGAANCLCAFEDFPRFYENWEINSYYKQKKYEIKDVSDVREIKGNGFGGFEIVRKYMNSTITQKILVYQGSRRIDIQNSIDWHEHHVLLKALFPLDIHTNTASYEIQFGSVQRPNHENTSWDKAKFEVCAHKWGDLSEEGYGVSILNDCKYGYSALGNEIALSLIKCGIYPNEEADQGMHEFVYSIYPHGSDFKHGGTIKEAYLLNCPLEATAAKGLGTMPTEYSLLSCDSENIIIETVKQAENKKGFVVRLYDAWGMKSNPVIKLGFESNKISICDLMENLEKEIGHGSEIALKMSNFEIVTLFIEV